MTEEQVKKNTGFAGLLSHVKGYKGHIVGNMLSNILTAVFSLLSIPLLIPLLDLLFDNSVQQAIYPESLGSFEDFEQYLNAIFIDYSNIHGKQNAILYVCFFFAGTTFLANFFRYLSLFFMAPVRQGIVKDLRNAMFHKMVNLPLSFFSEERKGDLMSRLTSDVSEVEWSILNVMEAIFRNPIMILGVLAFMIYASPSLTLFVFGLMLVAVLIISLISRTLRRSSGKAQETLGYLVSVVEEALGGLRIIKSFRAEKFQQDKFQAVNQDFNDQQVSILRRRDMASPMSEFLGVSIALILMYYGSSRVIQGDISAGAFIAYLFAFFQLISPVKALSNAYFNVQKGLAALDRLDAILGVRSSISSADDAQTIDKIREGIIVDDVRFQYNEHSDYVINHINLEIPKGKTLALVGESGSGKSTLVDLIPRFYDVGDGQITIDGIDIRNLKLDSLRNLFGIVTQEPILFNDSLVNNITFGLERDMGKVIDAAKMAHAHDFISETEDGYETIVGDRGTKLSGGQRQRITIARALYKNPEILIFDEATSALDTESERLVQEALQQATRDRTSIIIAHRLSTIQNADWIVVLDRGKIVEQGTHEELMALNHHYAKLVKMQQL